MAQVLPRALSIAAKAVITLLLLVLLFRKIEVGATMRHMRDINPLTGLLSLLILFGAVALATARWQIVLRSIGQNFTVWSLFRLNLIGLFFNQALPSAVGGDGMRVFLLSRQGCSIAESFNSVLIDRMAGLVFLVIMSLGGLPTLIDRLFGVQKGTVIAGIILGGLALCVLLFALGRARTLFVGFRIGRFAAQIVDDGILLARRPGDSAKITALSIGNQLSYFVLIWLILRDLGTPVSAIGIMIVAPVVLLLLVLPVSIAGWGLREGLFVIGFGLLNVPQDAALAASIAFGLLNLAAGLIGGVVWILGPARSRTPAANPHPAAQAGLSQPPAERDLTQS